MTRHRLFLASLSATLTVLGALSAAAAHARTDVQWSVSIGGPIGVQVYSPPYSPPYTQPVAVYASPVYVQPVYAQPVYVQPAYVQPIYVQPGHAHLVPLPARIHYAPPTHWDVDGDGIPNRHDRVYNPAWGRDGDGIPNRYERHHRQRPGYAIGAAPLWQPAPAWRDGHRHGR